MGGRRGLVRQARNDASQRTQDTTQERCFRVGQSSVLRILRNEMYAGTWYYNKFQCCEPRNRITSPRYRKRSKSSVRRRPASEWLPLVLPESLRIVPRERWLRVQQQLARNYAFASRNEKHT